MSKLNELAVINPQEVKIIPSADEMAALREDMMDLDRFPYGRIQIAAGGANVFKVTDPGEEDSTPATSIEGVIMYHHKVNGLWAEDFGGENKTPACSSMNGDEGINTETGEVTQCAGCPYNQFGSAGNGRRGKACKNMRRLYIMRAGDMFPMVLGLPPTALSVFEKYRVKVMMGHKPLHSIVTKITLKSQKNKEGTEYSSPVFTPVAILPPAEAERVKQYAEQFSGATQRAGLTSDDYLTADMTSAPPMDGEFTEIGEDELPFA